MYDFIDRNTIEQVFATLAFDVLDKFQVVCLFACVYVYGLFVLCGGGYIGRYRKAISYPLKRKETKRERVRGRKERRKR